MKKSFLGGVHPLPSQHQGKPLTNNQPIRAFVSDTVCIPLDMHIAAAPSKPVVKKGDHVLMGQLIAEAVGPRGVPVHASVSGTVKEIGAVQQLGKVVSPCITIENDFNDEWVELKGLGNVENCDAEQIIPAIREKDPDSVIIVGNPDWSKDLRSVADDPLNFDNILYTLHFYAASHGQDLRDMTEQLSQQGLPIFVTEFGVTSSSGGFPRDLESADLWIELLEREQISYCMWSFSSAPEPCSALRTGLLKYSGFADEDYNETGRWLLDTLARHSTR